VRPVTALAAFHLHEFRDLLTVVAQEIRRTDSRCASTRNPLSPRLVVGTRR
jgi:hypothetical protein